MHRSIRPLALALTALLAIAPQPASATIGARWSWPVTRWQPNLIARDAAGNRAVFRLGS